MDQLLEASSWSSPMSAIRVQGTHNHGISFAPGLVGFMRVHRLRNKCRLRGP
jgi:hypothetical protein